MVHVSTAHEVLAAARAIPEALHTRLDAHRGETAHHAVRVQLFTGDDALEREANAIASNARTLVDAGTSPKEIAVLLRSVATVAGIEDALLDRNVPV